jgi:methionine-R-sulfoxide reductase
MSEFFSGCGSVFKKFFGSDFEVKISSKQDFNKDFNREEKLNTLTKIQYNVTQIGMDEAPFNNEYWDNKEEGIYVDIVSGEPLFNSNDKYDAGTGWPSFTKPLEPKNVVLKRKGLLSGAEVRSRNADSFLGDVFKDGPQPAGLRFCVNSAAMEFIPKADLEKRGYGAYAAQFSEQKIENE